MTKAVFFIVPRWVMRYRQGDESLEDSAVVTASAIFVLGANDRESELNYLK